MAQLAVPVNVRNITRIMVKGWDLDEDGDVAYVKVQVGAAGGAVYDQFRIQVRNGESHALGRLAGSVGWNDLYGMLAPVSTPTGLTGLMNVAGATLAAKCANATVYLSSLGVLEPIV